MLWRQTAHVCNDVVAPLRPASNPFLAGTPAEVAGGGAGGNGHGRMHGGDQP